MFLSRWAVQNQTGITLVNLAVAVAIMAILTGGIGTAVVQIQRSSTATTNRLTAVREVQNAGKWIVRDARGASSIQLSGDADGFPLTIQWMGTDGHSYETEYVINLDNEIHRYHYTDRSVNPDPDIVTLVAQHISPSGTLCTFGSNNELILTLKSTVGFGSAARSENREYRAFPTPSLF